MKLSRGTVSQASSGVAPCHAGQVMCRGTALERLKPYNPSLKLPTPLVEMCPTQLDIRSTAREVYLKLENLTAVKSFKVRGALNAILAQKERCDNFDSVVASSQGNHSQGVAFACQALRKKSIIFMPESAPLYKVKQTRKIGAIVVNQGRTVNEATEIAMNYANKESAFFIHPYDNQDIIDGQATVGFEILSTHGEPDYVICPVGGGGLISGLVTAFSGTKTQIIGVQPVVMASMKLSLENDRLTSIPFVPSRSCGTLVTVPGAIPFDLLRSANVAVVTVTEEEISEAQKTLFREMGVAAEGAGVLAVAALTHESVMEKTVGKSVVAIISGGNVAKKDLE